MHPSYISRRLVSCEQVNKGHNRACDFWSLGVLMYEFLMGVTPFNAGSEEKIFEKILHSEKWLWFPNDLPQSSIDLTLALLEPNPSLRLGFLAEKCEGIKNHPFFNETLGENDDFNWRDYEAKKLMPPFLPSVRSPTDTSNFTTPPDWDEPVTAYRGYKRYDPFFQKW